MKSENLDSNIATSESENLQTSGKDKRQEEANQEVNLEIKSLPRHEWSPALLQLETKINQFCDDFVAEVEEELGLACNEEDDRSATTVPAFYHFETKNSLPNPNLRSIWLNWQTQLHAQKQVHTLSMKNITSPCSLAHTTHSKVSGGRTAKHPVQPDETSMVEAAQPPLKKRRRGKLPSAAVHTLRAWFIENIAHPYPTKEQREKLSRESQLSVKQVNTWFTNMRKRQWRVDMSAEERNELKEKLIKTQNKNVALKVATVSQQFHHKSSIPLRKPAPLNPVAGSIVPPACLLNGNVAMRLPTLSGCTAPTAMRTQNATNETALGTWPSAGLIQVRAEQGSDLGLDELASFLHQDEPTQTLDSFMSTTTPTLEHLLGEPGNGTLPPGFCFS